MRYALLALLIVTTDTFAITPTQQKQLDIKLTIEGRKEHPIVYMTRADMARAKANREKYPWAKAAGDKLVAEADRWANMSDEALLKLVPPEKACYAYGFTGCPVCGGTLDSWWGAGGVCAMDDPRHIKCVNGHRLPDEKHPDAGEGYVDANGRKYYFVGVWNSYIIDVLTLANTRLVHAYALTGDAKYAQKAAMLLDNLARIYPTSETGSWDYPSDPPSGRFNRPWYQVARTLVTYANQYDILMASDALDGPSSVPGISRRENIEQNLLLNGAAYCYRESVIHPALHNGQADYIRGPMAVAAAMGIPQYIAWGVDGPYSIRAMIANNVDRDGQYYETSAGYSDHARALYMDMAEILRNYTDAAHPDGINLSRDPVFVMFNRLARTRLRCATHPPSLGDDAPNLKRIATTRRIDRFDLNNIERLCALADEPTLIRQLDAMLLAMGDLESTRASFANSEWLLFHAGEVQTSATGAALDAGESSDLFSQKGLAILRSGVGENARAATLRFGPTLNHGHLDEMNLNIYARGYEMSYDLGYSLGSTHTQVGWAHTTASHNTVVVDETPQLNAGRSGGTLQSFTTLPGITIVRADDPACYQSQNVEQYARTVAMIDVNDELSYLVDIFRIRGGSKHDYFFHGLGTDMEVEGLKLSPPAAGSLAGAEFTFGDQIGSDGNVIGVLNKDYWNPPPQNGYGFLMHPRTSDPDKGLCSATWTIDRENAARLRLNLLRTQPTAVVICEAPGIYPKMPRSAYLVARRAGENLSSTFASIVEPYGDQRAIRRITALPPFQDDVVGAKIELADGRTDYVLWSQASEVVHFNDDGRDIVFAGGFAHIRCDTNGPSQVSMTGGRLLEMQGVKFSLPATEQTGSIERIDEATGTLYTKAKVIGPWLHVTNPAYAQESPYRIASITPATGDLTAIQLAPTRLVLGCGHLDVDPPDAKTLPNVVPIEYAKSVRRRSSGVFRGKRVSTPDGRASARIEDFDDQGLALTVDSSQGFRAGDGLIIYDVCAGDGIRIPTYLHATQTADGGWNVDSNGKGEAHK